MALLTETDSPFLKMRKLARVDEAQAASSDKLAAARIGRHHHLRCPFSLVEQRMRTLAGVNERADVRDGRYFAGANAERSPHGYEHDYDTPPRCTQCQELATLAGQRYCANCGTPLTGRSSRPADGQTGRYELEMEQRLRDYMVDHDLVLAPISEEDA